MQRLQTYELQLLNFVNFNLAGLRSAEKSFVIELIELLFKGSDGFRLSIGFKAPQFVYGELAAIQEYFNVFSHSQKLKNSDSVFCDLGCGLGKANLLVSASFDVKKSIGVEFIPKLVHFASAQKRMLANLMSRYGRQLPETLFIKGDISRNWEKWKDSDVIFINCVCWEHKMINRVLRDFEGLKDGTEIFSTNLLERKKLKLIKEVMCKSGWADSKIYLYVTENN